MKLESSMIIGACEWVALPSLGVPRLRARVDTGAKTCALHATDIATFIREDGQWVQFIAHTGFPDATHQVLCEARLVGIRQVRNTGGELEERYTIRTPIVIGHARWEVDITLSNREKMRYRMLLGRNAMKQHALVNPARTFLQGKPRI